jgi:plasmid stabilization system protein ParE
MRVRYTRRAFADREAIFAYLNQYDPRAAKRVKEFIKSKINSLIYSPRRARVIRSLGVHALGSVVTPTSSTIALTATSSPSFTFVMVPGDLGPAATTECTPSWRGVCCG